ncbi:hypothetical protein Adt_09315 [Abeliophyllum distichum]|uniref:DOG1 domain-containing protein n=1 Tax=Abeliophyllum distichum TaxID=126358 RepID=A0ABD1UGW1_9LAMI
MTSTGSLDEVSARQLVLINNLQSKTIQEESKLCSVVASLQENMLTAAIASKLSPGCRDPNEEANRALDEYMQSMVNTLENADKMRLNTLKELLNILTPDQGVNYLAAGKKLHLCIHEWVEYWKSQIAPFKLVSTICEGQLNL